MKFKLIVYFLFLLTPFISIAQNKKDKDGNPNLSPQLIEQLEEKRNNYLKLFD